MRPTVPGVFKAGVDVDRIARHVDLLPTFAEIVGGKPMEHDQLQGRSLVPLLSGEGEPRSFTYDVLAAMEPESSEFGFRSTPRRCTGRPTLDASGP